MEQALVDTACLVSLSFQTSRRLFLVVVEAAQQEPIRLFLLALILFVLIVTV